MTDFSLRLLNEITRRNVIIARRPTSSFHYRAIQKFDKRQYHRAAFSQKYSARTVIALLLSIMEIVEDFFVSTANISVIWDQLYCCYWYLLSYN